LCEKERLRVCCEQVLNFKNIDKREEADLNTGSRTSLQLVTFVLFMAKILSKQNVVFPSLTIKASN
jgi:hypothetical protein